MAIEKLKQEEKELNDLLSVNRSKQRELNKISFIQEHGFNVGDAVEWIDGNTLRKGVINGIDFYGVNPTYYNATLFNADGKLGKKNVRIWDYWIKSIKMIHSDCKHEPTLKN